MPSITRKFLTSELSDGRIIEERVLFVDQTGLAKTRKARGWDDDEVNGPTGNAFLAFLGLRRAGHLDASVTFDQFSTDWLVDVDLRTEKAETMAGDGTDADPTLAETTA